MYTLIIILYSADKETDDNNNYKSDMPGTIDINRRGEWTENVHTFGWT